MKKTQKALASLAIAGMALTMVPFNVFAAGTVPTRLAGTTAEQTAVKIADQTGWTGTAILASSASYGMVDALTAGPLSSYLKAPILLTGAGNVLNPATKAELDKLKVTKVYVTSGTAVISQGVLDELEDMDITVEPLGGFDRSATSVNIAKEMVGVTKVAVANGLQDALSIAAIASAANEPILLTDKNALPASVKAYLDANPGIIASDLIGGTGIISDPVKDALPSATRHYGFTAYDTNNKILQDFNASLTYGNVYVASGVTGIDALAGAPLAAQTKSAIVLTDGSVPAAASFVNSKLTAKSVVTALGGTFVVPTEVLDGIAYNVEEMKVTSVSALTNTNVSVTFKALKENDAAFTVVVKDNKGANVELLPVALETGETEATLTFKTPRLVAPTGVWTIGGLDYDLDSIKSFNDIVAAAGGTNQVVLLDALKDAGLKNITSANIVAYGTAIDNSTTKQDLADIQKLIDDTNAANLTAAQQAVVVKAVVDSKNQVQLLAALKNKAFTQVNSAWIEAYETAVAASPAITTASTVADVQAKIAAVNSTSIDTANENATTVATQNAVTDLITTYTVADVAAAHVKADAIKASQVKSAVFGVKEATTAATVYNALVKLSATDSTNLPASSLNAKLTAEYLTAKNAATINGSTTVAALKTGVVMAADTAALGSATAGIVNLTPASTTSNVKTALQKLADVTSHTADKFDMTKVKEGSLGAYLTALDSKILAEVESAAKVTAIIAGVNSSANEAANVATIAKATSTVAQVGDALTEIAAGTTSNATATAYLNASSQVKLEVAQFVVNNRSSLATPLTAAIVLGDAGTTYATAPLKTALAAHVAKLVEFNVIGNLADATNTSTQAAVIGYGYAPFVALTATQQLVVAEGLNKLTKATSATDSTPVALNFSGVDAVKTLAQANAYIDAAIAE